MCNIMSNSDLPTVGWSANDEKASVFKLPSHIKVCWRDSDATDSRQAFTPCRTVTQSFSYKHVNNQEPDLRKRKHLRWRQYN